MNFGSERRRYKRIDLSAPVEIKRLEQDRTQVFENALTDNIGQGGLYLRTATSYDLKPGDRVFVHISIPREKTDISSFSRLIGKARVLRMERLAGDGQYYPACLGLALEFDKDVIFLSVAN